MKNGINNEKWDCKIGAVCVEVTMGGRSEGD
jgi:hypothetical protein